MMTDNSAYLGSPSQLTANALRPAALRNVLRAPLVGSIRIRKIAVIMDVAMAMGIKYMALKRLLPGSRFLSSTASRNPSAAWMNTVPKKKITLLATAVQKVLSCSIFV